ncbi:MAG: hypothetical protein K2K21_14570 [Lachnospiraceae bacterium]|nr:hypothetical protein [Lachnospiraceae bacterium]
MIKYKNTKKDFGKIGKRWHNFDLKSEKKIYCYLWFVRNGILKPQRLDNDLKFESYQQWKKYVNNKYENFNVGELIEFSRYLNQSLRIIKPTQEYMMIIMTALMTLSLSKLIDFFVNRNIELSNIMLENIIRTVIYSIVFILSIFFFVIPTFMPILKNDTEKNFLSDYKEIIDEMISEKMKQKI